MSGSLEERLTELEVRLSFVDDSIASLSDTVASHDRQLHEIRSLLERLHTDLLAVRGAFAHDVHDEPPPPHY
jgi:SlyX protein